MADTISKRHIYSVLLLTFFTALIYIIFSDNFHFWHLVLEIVPISISITIFMLFWNSKDQITNNFWRVHGIGFLFIAILDFLHAATFIGVSVADYSPDLQLKYWIVGRFYFAFTFLIALFFKDRKSIGSNTLFLINTLITSFMIAIINLPIFPTTYINGVGLTKFKIYSEFVVMFIFIIISIKIYFMKNDFNPLIYYYLNSSYFLTIISEIFFVMYFQVNSIIVYLGHLFKIFAFYFIYEILVAIVISEPFDTIFQDLSKTSEKLRIQLIRNKELERKKISTLISEQQTKLNVLQQFSAGITHDFNNILTVLTGNIALLELDKDIPKFINNINTSIDQAKQLAKQIMNLAKNTTVQRKYVNINPIIKNTCDVMNLGTSQNLIYDLDENLQQTTIIVNQFIEAIQNVIFNAIQAIPEYGTITIKTRNCDITNNKFLSDKKPNYESFIAVKIIDTGIGISEELMEKVFTPFYTTKSYGTGLGLTITQNIIKTLDGYMQIESELNKGTEVSIYIPIIEKTVDDLEIYENKEVVYDKGKILIMDDQIDILKTLREMLTSLGYDVITCNNGDEAIKIAKMEEFDIIILDLTVKGGISGEKIAKRIRKVLPQSKIICTSGHLNSPIMLQYHKFGFDNVLPKPYNIEELSNILFESKK